MGSVTKSARLEVRMPPDLYARLVAYADTHTGSMAAHARAAIAAYLDRRSLDRQIDATLHRVRGYINTSTPQGAAMLERVNELLDEMG